MSDVALSVLVSCYGGQEWLHLGREAFNGVADHDRAQTLFIYHADMTLAEVRNAIADEATGRWLCFLDGDDELDPGFIPAMLAAIDTSEAAGWDSLLVPSVTYVMDGRESHVGIPNQGRWPSVNECVIGTVHRRDRFRIVGGFREFDLYEDWDLWLRLAATGSRLRYVPEAVYRAHVHAGSRNVGPTASQTYQQIWGDYVALRERTGL